MAVDGLEDRAAGAHVREVLLHDVEVVALGVQRRDAALGALAAVVAVVVVGGDVRDVLVAEQPHEPARDRRLAGGRVADDAEDDGTGHGSLAKTELRRMSSDSMVMSSSRESWPPRSNRRAAWRRRARSIALRMLRALAKRGWAMRRSTYSRSASFASSVSS